MNAGGVFSIIWMVLFVLFWVGAVTLFWQNKEQQPIKGRQPVLVLFTDVILLIYTVQLCFQRIFADSYPCALNLWTGFLGTIILFNFYLWRCWVLYFRFRLTQAKLAEKPLDANSLVYQRKYEHPRFLTAVFVLVTIVLLIPCVAFHGVTPSIDSQQGDSTATNGCQLSWSRYVLVVYVVLYVIAFSTGAYFMRVVVDGFKIKEELRATGVVGILCVLPWALFNTTYSDINANTFPFSTLALLLAIVTAFILSTVWPLYRALYKPPIPEQSRDDTVDCSNLAAQLSTKAGYDNFEQFLTTEFSVENLQFFTQVERYREKVTQWTGSDEWDKIKAEAERIHKMFIGEQASHQVNLPSGLVRDLDAAMKTDLKGLTIDSATSVKVGVNRYGQPIAGANGGSPSDKKGDAKTADGGIALTEVSLKVEGANGNGNGNGNSNGSNGAAAAGSGTDAGAGAAGTGSGGSSGGAPGVPRSASMAKGTRDPKRSFIVMRATETLTVFDMAQKSIFGLMESDAFSRYKRSDMFAAFISSSSKSKRKEEVLKSMDLA